MKPIHLTIMLLLLLGTAARGDDQSDRQKLAGSWELQGATGNSPASAWTFSQDRASIRVTEVDGGSKVADFACRTDGTPCEAKSAGKKTTVSMWFLGPRLVEMETKGAEVVKRRFRILPQGDLMEMEVIPIVPAGKTETFQFKRAQLSARQ